MIDMIIRQSRPDLLIVAWQAFEVSGQSDLPCGSDALIAFAMLIFRFLCPDEPVCIKIEM